VSNYIETLDYIPGNVLRRLSAGIYLTTVHALTKMKLWLWTEKNAETGFISGINRNVSIVG